MVALCAIGRGRLGLEPAGILQISPDVDGDGDDRRGTGEIDEMFEFETHSGVGIRVAVCLPHLSHGLYGEVSIMLRKYNKHVGGLAAFRKEWPLSHLSLDGLFSADGGVGSPQAEPLEQGTVQKEVAGRKECRGLWFRFRPTLV